MKTGRATKMGPRRDRAPKRRNKPKGTAADRIQAAVDVLKQLPDVPDVDEIVGDMEDLRRSLMQTLVTIEDAKMFASKLAWNYVEEEGGVIIPLHAPVYFEGTLLQNYVLLTHVILHEFE